MSGEEEIEIEQKMNVEAILTNSSNVVGLIRVENFDGVVMHMNPTYLKEALSLLATFGNNREDLQIGISNSSPGGTFFIFLDKKCEIALAAAGRQEK